jgi:hypothetical protein
MCIDCEGWVSITGRHANQIIVGVLNTDPRLLAWLQSRFGGYISPPRVRTNPRAKPAWTWLLWSPRAQVFLRAIRPYLILKGEQADIALAFALLLGPKGKRLTPARQVPRDALRRRLRVLNRRGDRSA